jgi:parallel beta-helix repeat protein
MILNGSYNLISQNSFSIIPGSDGGSVSGINILSGNHNTVSNNTLYGQGTGIAVGLTGPGGSYNLFLGNTVENAGLWGILMGNGSYNVFYGNLIANNRGFGHDGYGLALGGNHLQVNSNLFYHNEFVNNSRNFGVNWDVNGIYFFDSGKEGNYWDDYLTQNPNSTPTTSGIGDKPYLVFATATRPFYDNYPLMNKPDVTGIFPILPEPWLSLVQITVLSEPQPTETPVLPTISPPTSITTPAPTTTETPSFTDPTLPETTRSTGSPTNSQENSVAEPTIPTMTVVLGISLMLILVASTLIFLQRRRSHQAA